MKQTFFLIQCDSSGVFPVKLQIELGWADISGVFPVKQVKMIHFHVYR